MPVRGEGGGNVCSGGEPGLSGAREAGAGERAPGVQAPAAQAKHQRVARPAIGQQGCWLRGRRQDALEAAGQASWR